MLATRPQISVFGIVVRKADERLTFPGRELGYTSLITLSKCVLSLLGKLSFSDVWALT
jgi:hypothetical protein